MDRALLFWRLVAEAKVYKLAKLIDKNEYNADLTTLNTASLEEIATMIKKYEKQSYFKLEDFIDSIVKLVDLRTSSVRKYSAIKYSLKQLGISNEVINKILYIYFYKYINENEFMDVDAYVDLVRSIKNLPPEIKMEADQKLLDYMIYIINSDEDSSSVAFKIARIINLDIFPRNLILDLIKNYGSDLYADVFALTFKLNRKVLPSESSGDVMVDDIFKGKNKLTENEITIIFRNKTAINKYEFQNILQRATTSAKQYLQSFLYYDAIVGMKKLFMIAEDGTPMTSDYKIMPLPDKIKVIQFKHLPEDIQKIWSPILSDFKIVPA